MTGRLFLVAMVAVSLLSMACRGGGDGEGPTQDPPTTDASDALPAETPTTAATAPAEGASPAPPIAGSAGCGGALPADVAPGERAVLLTQSGGMERNYRIYVPSGFDNETPMPLLLNWHGRGSNALQQEAYSGYIPISEREGFVLVSPNGVDGQWLTVAGVDDIQFARDLVEELSAGLCIDTGRIFSSGMSNGAFMSTQLACQMPETIAAIAPVAGAAEATNCSTPVPAMFFAGRADEIVPFGPGGLILGVLPYIGLEAAVGTWAELNGCGSGVDSPVSDEVTRREFEGCAATTVLYIVEEGGHSWPGSAVVPGLGGTTQDISASELAWEFFMAHPKPAP